MNTYTVKVKGTFEYEFEVEANDYDEAEFNADRELEFSDANDFDIFADDMEVELKESEE